MTRIHSIRPERGSNMMYHVGALIAVTAWGGSFICTKVLLNSGLSAVEIYLCRFFLAYIFTMLICPRPFFSRSLRDELLFFLCGVCGGSVYFIAENVAVEYTLVSNVSLIVTLSPLLTTIIVAVMYKSERISKGVVVGSLIALAGVACVIFNSSLNLQVNPIGDLLSLLAAICWAVYSVILRPLTSTYSTWFITRKTFFYGLVTALPFLLLDKTHMSFSMLLAPEVFGNLLFLGLFASLVSYLLWGSAVKHLGAVKTGNYLYFCPIVTLILSVWLLSEKVSVVGYIGCALILGGVIASEKIGKGTPEGRDSAPR
ncbi:MAG: DMT family transporter [Paramuribaculum sp.]|nr:DMT family transporter [Paramuribaculum sp.]